MSTKTRNLSNIDGAAVSPPTNVGFTTNGLEAFASDAAFEAVFTPVAGSLYWNTTAKLVRQYMGTDWQNDKTAYETQADSTTTGANQDITPGVDQLIRFTHGSLTSIRSISPATQSVISFINGQASQNITIVNESAGATAANRIVTGTNTDFTLKPGAAVGFVYDSAGSRWRLSSGGGGGGLQPVVKTANFVAEAGNNYLTDTTSGAIAVTLPAGADGSTMRFVDATEKWGTNNLTLTPASGQTIDMLAANEALTCDVTRGWVELSWDGTRWAFSSLASTTVGEASASAPGIVSTGTQSFAGVKTYNDGLNLDEAVGQTTLNYFRSDSTSSAIQNMTTSPSITVLATRIGSVVTVTIPASGLLTKNGSNGPMTVPIGAAFTPLTATSNYYGVGYIGGTDTAVLFQITTAGVINMYSTIAGNNVAAGATNIGWPKQSFTYHIT